MAASDTWIVNSCLWTVPFLLITIAFSYYFYKLYLLFRRHKFGFITTGKVIKKWTTESSSDMQKTTEYHLRYTFDDKRQEIHDMYLDHVMKQFISNTYLPNDIVNLLKQYLGDSLTFYYGPYHSEELVSSVTYDNVCEGDPIQVQYDPKYPQNVCIYHKHHTLDNCCTWWLSFICICIIFIGSMCGLKVTIDSMRYKKWKSMMLMIFIPSIFITSLVIAFCSFKKRFFCFRHNLLDKLQFVNDIDDEDTIQSSCSLHSDLYTVTPNTNITAYESEMESSETSDEGTVTDITLTHHFCVQNETKINIPI